MRKQNLLKLAFTMLAMIVMTGAMAQNSGQWGTTASVGDYVRSNADPANLDTPEEANTAGYGNKVTIGNPIPFFVWPSAVYNPNWDPTAAALTDPYASQIEIETNVESNFSWKFEAFDTNNAITETAFDGATADATYTKNYVELTWTLANLGIASNDDLPVNQLIQVIETPTTGYACEGTPVYFGVQIIDQPMVKFNLTTSNGVLGLNDVYQIGCEGSEDVTLPANTVLNILTDNGQETPIGNSNDSRYHVNLTFSVRTYSLNVTTGFLENPVVVDFADAPVKVVGVDGAAAPSQANPILAETLELVAGQAYTTYQNKPTVYTFQLTDWNAGISRKSDYKKMRDGGFAYTDYDEFTYYSRNSDVNAVTLAHIIVMPKPITGPIYHIPNTYAF